MIVTIRNSTITSAIKFKNIPMIMISKYKTLVYWYHFLLKLQYIKSRNRSDLFIILVMKKRNIPVIQNKPLRIAWAIVCIIVLIWFIAWVVIWAIWWYNYDVCLMKTWIRMSVVSWIFMWMLHILYFRTPKTLRKKLFGE